METVWGTIPPATYIYNRHQGDAASFLILFYWSAYLRTCTRLGSSSHSVPHFKGCASHTEGEEQSPARRTSHNGEL